MSYVKYYSCYAGHGAMNYFEVYDDSGYIEKRILIDAGCNCDNYSNKEAKRQFSIIRKTILNSDDQQCIFCLTHPHEDHYKFLTMLLDCASPSFKILDKFYIGGIDDFIDANDIYDLKEWDEFKDVFLFWKNVNRLQEYEEYEGDFCEIIEKRTSPRLLWESEDEEVSLYVMYNRVIDSDDANDLSASFVVKNECSGNLVWVTGDSTGHVFYHYLRDYRNSQKLRAVLKDERIKGQIYITAPHHGSIRTLSEAGFDKYWGNGWAYLCNSILEVFPHRLILGACQGDKFGNPDAMALKAFLPMCEDRTNGFGWDIYDSTQSIPELLNSGEFDPFFTQKHIEKKIDNDDEDLWYRQFVDKYVYPTARFLVDKKQYIYNCEEIIL